MSARLPFAGWRDDRSYRIFLAASADIFTANSDINWVIMDYLVSEGYPAAAEKFAQETNLCAPSDIEGIRGRVRIRTAIYKGDISEAVGLINEVDAEVSLALSFFLP